MWHLVVAIFTLGMKLLNALVVLFVSLISGTSR
jgi:hypothetical protein